MTTKKCKQGFKYDKKKGKCTKLGVPEDLNPTTPRFFGFSRNKKVGLFLLVIAFLIWMLRPFQDCAWYELACKGGSFLTTPIFLIIIIILVIVGVWKLIKKDG